MIKSFLGNIEGWKSVLDSSPDLIAILDREFNVVWVNKAMALSLDASPDSCLGLKCFEAVHGTQSPIPNCPHAKMILDGQEYTEEVNEENLGECFLVTASPIKNESGDVLGSIHIVRDISKRKKAEKSLQESKEHYQRFFDNPLNGFALCEIITDGNDEPVDFVYLEVNNAFENFTGLKRENVLNKKVSDVLPYEEVAPAVEIYGKVALTGESEQFEITIPSLNKTYDIIAFSPQKMQFIAMFTDITKQKEAEDKIHRLANIVESSDDAIITKSLEGSIIGWNKGAERIYGYSAEEVFGKPISILEPSQLNQETEELINKIKSGKRIDHYETLRLKKDGKIINVSITLSPVFDISGELVAISAISRDITERKKVEKQNQKLLEDVQQLNEELEVSNEELQVSNEELHAVTEELQVSNDELQNTTEELQVANEELRQQGEDLAYLNQELHESEQRVRLKLESIISPDVDIGNLDLADILDIEAVQSLMDDFHEIVSIPMAIIDLKGEVLVGVGWQDICTKFHRVHPETCKYCIESDTQLSAGVPEGEFKLYKCKNNMWDIATPIIVGGKHIGNLFSGQFFFDDEQVDYGLFKKQAQKYNFNEKDYINALKSVPKLSRDSVNNAMAFFIELAEMISQMSYNNIKLARSLTERDALTDSLRESEQRMNRSQEIGHIGSWELDLVHNHLFWSDEVYRIFGLQPQEFDATYEAFLEAVHPDDREAVDAAYSGSLHEGKDTYEIEHRVVRKSTGEIRIVYEKCEHIRDESGMVIRSVGMVHDITERKKAEDALKESEESAVQARNEWEHTFEAVPDLIAILDTDYKVIRANKAMSDRFGITPEECVGLTCYEVVHGMDKPPAFCPHQQLLEDGSEHTEEVHEDSLGGDFLVSASPLHDSEGKLIGSVHVARDINERKKKEKELHQLNKAYRALTNSSQAMIRAKNELEYLDSVCNIVVEDCGHSMVWIGYAEEDENRTVRPMAYAGFEEGYVEGLDITWADDERGNGPTGTAIRTHKISICKNMLTDPKFKPWREEAVKRGYASSLVLPLIFENKALGAISIYSSEQDPFSENEIKLLTELADNLAYGINVIRLRIAREEMKEALIRSENEFRTLAENSPDVIARFDRQNRHIYVNPAAAEPYGLLQEDIIGKTHAEIEMDPEKIEFWERHHNKVFATGKPETMEFKYKSPQGEKYYYNTQIVPEFVDGEVKSILAISRDITYIKEAESELKEARDNLEEQVKERTLELEGAYESLKLANAYNRSLIEASLDPLVTIGPDGKITDVNGATELVTGCSRDELIGTDFSDYFTEPENARKGYQEVFREGHVFNYPLEIKHKDGHTTPVLYNASVYRDESGEVIGVFAAARDITERKKAEENIQRLANIVESSNDAIITKSLDGVITSWNNGAEEIYGYLTEEILGKPISALEPDDLKGETKELVEMIKTGEKIHHYETSRLKKNGELIDISITLSPVFDMSGKLMAISTIARDITERKKAEEELKKAGKYNRSLIETSLDPLVTIGPDGKITDVNMATELVTGYSRDELIGTDFSDYFTEPDKAREGYQEVFRNMQVFDYPLEIKHKDGPVTPVLYNASVYHDESNNVIGVFAAARDITERKKAEKLLKLKLEELARSNAELEQFAYVSSHDLQEPLRMIGSYLQLLQRRYQGQLDDKADKYINFAVDGASRMQNLINDLLEFSRVTTRAKEFEPTDCELILDHVLSNLEVSIKENKAVVSHNHLPAVMADSTQLAQVFQNLISNAIKFRSEETPKIYISAEKEDDKWIFSVADNGIGIDPKHSEKIFEVFKRLHKRREYPGTGIGLSICKKIIERHGGHIWVESEPDKGSIFYFTIPEEGVINGESDDS